MVDRVGGFRRKTRGKLSKNFKSRGKISLTKYFQEFNKGDKVALIAEPSVQKGMYFPRFHGKTAVVKCKTGECYEVKIKDGDKEKVLIVHPIHLKRLE